MKWLKSLSVLQIALGLSILVHAALLAVRFADPERFDRIVRDASLEVILLNAKARDQRPEKPTAVAQSALAGGGDLDRGRASSPLPPSAFSVTGDSADQAQKQIEALQAQQTQMLTQIKQQLAALPAPDPSQADQPSKDTPQEERRRQLLDLLAAIEKRMNEENARPKKRYVSPSTKEAVYAVYVDALRRKIEARGTEQFPEAQGRKLYGQLMMTVGVDAEGRLINAEINRGSGNRDLDRRAQAIVRSLGRFERFTPAMQRQVDQLYMVMTFTFARDQTLQTEVREAQSSPTPTPPP